MTIKSIILSDKGIKEATDSLIKELEPKFVTRVRCYQAAANIIKAAKDAQNYFVSEKELEKLIEEHRQDIVEHRHFTHDGIDCYIRERINYNYDKDEKYQELLKRFNNAKERLDNCKKKMEQEGLAEVKSATYIFEAHGESK